jgi:multidrug transporter EmrE-like cation transporter
LFGEAASAARIVSIAMIAGGIIGLKISSTS